MIIDKLTLKTLQSHHNAGRWNLKNKEDNMSADWKLKLRYGKLITPYSHYTLLAEGVVTDEFDEGFDCPKGNAIMSMKVWATSNDEAIDMIKVIGENIGFIVTGRIYVYSTEPEIPPQENPHGYDINFKPYFDS